MTRAIVLNGRVTVRGRITGVERMAREVISRLVSVRPDVYRVLAPARERRRGQELVWEQVALPAVAARMHASIVYSPGNVAPVAWPRNVVVIHDASVWRSPGSFSPAYTAWHRQLETVSARRAKRVVTVSEFSRRELIDILGLDPEAVVVVPNGVSERFRADSDPEPVRLRYGLSRPYVLTVGSAQGRKNVALLDELARRLADRRVEMVWAGSPSRSNSRVRALGFVDDAQLPGLYAGAELFVMPSRYEGFGIPCLEAMACGTPVVAADRAALPETCGGAAVLTDPDAQAVFAEAVLALLDDADERGRLRERGLSRAREFTWERAAARTDAILCEVARMV